MSRTVLDANMLASASLTDKTPPGQILDAWRLGGFELCLSDHLLAEVRRTLDKPYFQSRLSRDRIDQFLRGLAEQAVIVPLTATIVGVATHPEDDLVLATAISAEAEY